MKDTTWLSTAQPGLVPNADVIPQIMRDAPRWLLHDSKKIPYYANGNPRSGKLNSPRDLARLVQFVDALPALEGSERFIGLGFALGGEFQGCDLDGVRDPKTGVIDADVLDLIERAGTYAEISPSGTGIHLIFRGELQPLTLGANGSRVEFYSGERYFTVTGNVLNGQREVIPASAEVIDILTRLHLKPGEQATQKAPKSVAPTGRANAEWPGFAYELRQKLKHVPCVARDYARWRDIGMIIKLESGAAEEGFDIWHEWSEGVAGYVSPEDCRKYWNSFKNDHPNPLRWPTLKKLYLDVYTPKARATPTPGKLPMVIDSAGDLYEKEIAPVERLTLGRLEFTPGVTVLAGKPKHGKSWLAMGCAVAFTTGDEYLESRAACAMQGVYVACDDSSRRRFANRLRAFKPKMRPDGLLVITSIDPKAGSSLELLGALLKTHPAIRFVVIDTLSAFRESQRSDSPYQQEYDEVLALNDWAHEHNVCVLLVHHLRKGEIDIHDPYESISGTLGLQGACDGLLVLYRRDLESDVDEALDQKLAGLWYRGRDLDNDVATGIALADGRWSVFGRGRIVDVFAAQTRREILRVLATDPARWWTAKEIHAAGDFNCKAESVKRTASRMARSKEIEAQLGHGGGFRARTR